MKAFFFTFLSFIAAFSLSAQDVVVLNEHIELSIKNASEADYVVEEEMLILTRRGLNISMPAFDYDNFKRIKSIELEIFDWQGNAVAKFKTKDFSDYSLQDGFSLFQDNRIKIIDISHYALPLTLNIRVNYHLDGLLFYPKWSPIKSTGITVNKSSFAFQCPVALKPIFYANKLSPPDSSTVGNTFSANWEIENLDAIKQEDFMPPLREITPNLVIEPRNFEIDNVPGDMSSWQSFGNWITSLYNQQSNLPADLKNLLDEKFRSIEDAKTRAEAIFTWMQESNRYVSIQFGIGAWQPLSVEDVFRTSYGDCKALSNYTVAMLNYVGIESYYALVRAGEDHMPLENKPTARFNHAIACCIINADTLWMECTSNTLPFGYLGSFTSCRNVLLVKENQSCLVKTPCPSQDLTYMSRKTKLLLHADKMELQSTMIFSGDYFDRYEHYVSYNKADLQKEAYNELNSFWSFNIKNIQIVNTEQASPKSWMNLNAEVLNYSINLGKRLLVPVFPYKSKSVKITSDSSRVYPLVITSSRHVIDSIFIDIPVGFSIPAQLDDFLLENELGKYSLSLVAKENQVLAVRSYFLKKGVYPPEKHQLMVQLNNFAKKSDDYNLLFVPSQPTD